MRKRHELRQKSCGLSWPVTPSEFAAFYESTWSQVYRYCAAVLHDPDASEEAAQLTYSQLWEFLSQPAYSSGIVSDSSRGPEGSTILSLDPVSHSISIRLFLLADLHIDLLRKRFRTHIRRHADLEHALEIVDASPSPHHVAAQQELTRLLYQYLNRVDERCRELLILYFFKELTHGQIAQLFNMDRTSVTKHLRHALEELRGILPYAARKLLSEL